MRERYMGQLDPVAAVIVANRKPPGPVKWCKRCGRRHAARASCRLTRNADGRWCHAGR